LGGIALAVAALVQGVDVEVRLERDAQRVPRVGVPAEAVQEEERGALLSAPVEGVKPPAVDDEGTVERTPEVHGGRIAGFLGRPTAGRDAPRDRKVPGRKVPGMIRRSAPMLVNCSAYEDGCKVADVPVDKISDYLQRPGCFVWVALNEPDAGELDAMQREFGLHELAVEDAHHGHERPKIEEYGDSLFVVLHTVDAGPDGLSVGGANILGGRTSVLSVRNRSQRGFTDVRARCEREPALLRHGAGYVLYALVDTVVDRYFPVLDNLESELETV